MAMFIMCLYLLCAVNIWIFKHWNTVLLSSEEDASLNQSVLEPEQHDDDQSNGEPPQNDEDDDAGVQDPNDDSGM